jgi:BTB/POZ domain-containing protein KCTD9
MFHKKCDKQGPTITFVQEADNERVFGGYTSVSWNSTDNGEYKSDPHAFVFSLTNETYHPVK